MSASVHELESSLNLRVISRSGNKVKEDTQDVQDAEQPQKDTVYTKNVSINQPLQIDSFCVSVIQQSQIPSDRCCCNKLPGYPRNWPKLYIINKIISNILNIGGLISDFLFLFQSIEYNHHFLKNCNDKHRSNEDCSFTPVQVKSGYEARFWFTFSIPILIYILGGTIIYRKEKYKGCFYCIIFIGAIIMFGVCFIYKLLMILLALYRILLVLTLIKTKKIPVEMELFDKNLSNVFIYESMLSSWPLWVLSLIELQEWYNINLTPSQITSDYTHSLLIIKVFCTCITILLASDKISAWVFIVDDPMRLIIKCENYPYVPMRLITKYRNDDPDCKCHKCNKLFFPQFGGQATDIKLFHCSGNNCNNYLCTDCAWQYLQQYKREHNMTDKELYAKLENKLKRIYVEDHTIEYSENENHAFIQPLIADDVREEVDNPQREPFSMKGCCLQVINHGLCLLLFGLMYPAFDKVWIKNEHKYSDNYLLIDTTLFYMIGLGLKIVVIIEQMLGACCVSCKPSFGFITRWTHNVDGVFCAFAFWMSLFNFNTLWEMSATVRVSMVLQCIMTFLPLAMMLCSCYCALICVPTENSTFSQMQRLLEEIEKNKNQQSQSDHK